MIDLKGAAYAAVQAATSPWRYFSGAAERVAGAGVEGGKKVAKLAGDTALETMGLGSKFAAGLGASAGKWLVILVAVGAAALFAIEAIKGAARKAIA